MKKILIITALLLSMFLILSTPAKAGYEMIYNPLIFQNLDYVRDGNWSDYNGTMEFNSIDVAGGYDAGGVTIEENGDFWTKGDIYLDNGTVFLITNPVINGSFYPSIDNAFDLGSSDLSWKEAYLNSVYAGNGSATNPSHSFTEDSNTGFYTSGDTLWVTLGGAARYYFGETTMGSSSSTGAGIATSASSSTAPGLRPRQADPNTGLGWVSEDILSLISGGVSTLQVASTYLNAKVPIRMDNDVWLQSWNNASDSAVNMFKVNEDDEILVGSTLVTGNTEIAEDSGAVTLVDMAVSSDTTAGDEMSYGFNIDGTSVAKVYSQADGSGSIVNESFDVTTDNGIRVGASTSGDQDVTVISILESEGVTGQIKWDDGLTAWDMTQPLGSFRFTGTAVSMTGVYTSPTWNGQVDATGTGTTGLILSSQDALSPDILVDANRDGAGVIYLGNNEGDNTTIQSSDRLIVNGQFQAPKTQYTCDSTTEGYIYYNTTSKQFLGCNSTDWNTLG
mgnify:CR=1 FL=1